MVFIFYLILTQPFKDVRLRGKRHLLKIKIKVIPVNALLSLQSEIFQDGTIFLSLRGQNYRHQTLKINFHFLKYLACTADLTFLKICFFRWHLNCRDI